MPILNRKTNKILKFAASLAVLVMAASPAQAQMNKASKQRTAVQPALQPAPQLAQILNPWIRTPVQDIAAAGDSITMGYNADCTSNNDTPGLLCLIAGEQPQHSWFDGTDAAVESVHDKYLMINNTISANKFAAESGAEMSGAGDNGPERNFYDQAKVIALQTPVPDHVEVILGGNDICNRDCTNPANCSDPLYTNAEWRGAIQDGLDILMGRLPLGSTVYFGSVPRVQDLYQAGLDRQAADPAIECETIWDLADICPIVTDGGIFNNETLAQRHAAIERAQRTYNKILYDVADEYNRNTNGKNPRGIEVVSEYSTNQLTPTIANYQFTGADITADCFHPNVASQNVVADFMWDSNPDK